jgi:hypothetical protein
MGQAKGVLAYSGGTTTMQHHIFHLQVHLPTSCTNHDRVSKQIISVSKNTTVVREKNRFVSTKLREPKTNATNAALSSFDNLI